MLLNYCSSAFRNFKKRLGYSLLNCIGLALGMAGGIVLFLFIYFHYQTDRHHNQADHIFRVVLDLHLEDGSVEHESGVSLPMAEALRQEYAAVDKVTFIKEIISPIVSIESLTGEEDRRFLEEEAVVAFADPGYFEIFSYHWQEGSAAKALLEPNTAVLTEKYALKYFGQKNVVGRLITIQDVPLQVTGVVADYPPTTDLRKEVFVSLSSLHSVDPAFDPTDFSWTSGRHQLFLKLKHPAEAAILQAQLPAFSNKYFGPLAKAYQFILQPLHEVHFDARYGGSISWTVLGMLALVGVFLIGVACMNFINLTTVQAFLRAKEIGVRKVLGSTRRQIFMQFMIETCLMVIVAGLLAVGLSLLCIPLMNKWLATEIDFSHLTSPAFFLFFLLLLAIVTLIAGSYPALILSHLRPVISLKAGKDTPKGVSLRKILVVAQFTIALLLIISTLIVTQQLQLLEKRNMGFEQTARVSILLPKTSDSEREMLRNQLMALSGVEQLTFQHSPPASESNIGGNFRFDNRSEWEDFPIRDKWADSHYLEVYGLALVAGRNFLERDSLVEVVVNETFVEKLGFSSPEQVLNKSIEDGTRGTKGVIVGVVKDFHLQSLRQAIEPSAIFYYPSGFTQVGLKLHTQRLAPTLAKVQQQWQQLLPHSVFSYKFLDEQIARFYEKEQLIGRLVKLFSGLTIFIACLGLFGLATFMAHQRSKEISIRKVLGASVSSLVVLLSKDFARLVLFAFLIASPLAWYLAEQWLQDFTYRIQVSWWIFAVSGMFTLLIALLTVSFQALKAALANPVKALSNQ